MRISSIVKPKQGSYIDPPAWQTPASVAAPQIDGVRIQKKKPHDKTNEVIAPNFPVD